MRKRDNLVIAVILLVGITAFIYSPNSSKATTRTTVMHDEFSNYSGRQAGRDAAQNTSINAAIPSSQKGATNGVATTGSDLTVQQVHRRTGNNFFGSGIGRGADVNRTAPNPHVFNTTTSVQGVLFTTDRHFNTKFPTGSYALSASSPYKNNSSIWGRIVSFKNISAVTQALHPRNYIDLGDTVTDSAASWNFCKWVNLWIVNKGWVNWPATSLSAIMGNHDFTTGWGEPYSSYWSSLPYRAVLLTVARPVAIGATTVTTLEDPTPMISAGACVTLITSPDIPSSLASARTYENITCLSADSTTKTITFKRATTKAFSPGDECRWGTDEQKAVDLFLDAYRETVTNAQNHVVLYGNNAFIMFSGDGTTLSDDLPPEINNLGNIVFQVSNADLDWLERQVQKYEKGYNIFICTHASPGNNVDMGNIWNTGNYFATSVMARFKALCANHKVVAWCFGHAHPDWRDGFYTDVPSGWGGTRMILLPPTSEMWTSRSPIGGTGEVVTADFKQGATTVVFKCWTTPDGQARFPTTPGFTVSVNLPYADDNTYGYTEFPGRPKLIGDASRAQAMTPLGNYSTLPNGGNAVGFSLFSSHAPVMAAPPDIWVNYTTTRSANGVTWSTGNNSNNGLTSGAAIKNFDTAYAKIPLIYKGVCTIHLAPASAHETFHVTPRYPADKDSKIVILGSSTVYARYPTFAYTAGTNTTGFPLLSTIGAFKNTTTTANIHANRFLVYSTSSGYDQRHIIRNTTNGSLYGQSDVTRFILSGNLKATPNGGASVTYPASIIEGDSTRNYNVIFYPGVSNTELRGFILRNATASGSTELSAGSAIWIQPGASPTIKGNEISSGGSYGLYAQNPQALYYQSNISKMSASATYDIQCYGGAAEIRDNKFCALVDVNNTHNLTYDNCSHNLFVGGSLRFDDMYLDRFQNTQFLGPFVSKPYAIYENASRIYSYGAIIIDGVSGNKYGRGIWTDNGSRLYLNAVNGGFYISNCATYGTYNGEGIYNTSGVGAIGGLTNLTFGSTGANAIDMVGVSTVGSVSVSSGTNVDMTAGNYFSLTTDALTITALSTATCPVGTIVVFHCPYGSTTHTTTFSTGFTASGTATPSAGTGINVTFLWTGSTWYEIGRTGSF